MAAAIIGSSEPYYVTVLLWLARTVFFAFIASFLLMIGLIILDALTTHHDRDKIGESPVAIGLFVGGFLVFEGLVIHGAGTLPYIIGASHLNTVFAPTRLELLAAGFFVSLLAAAVLFRIFDRLTPKIKFIRLNNEPLGAGMYAFGIMLFFGLIIHAALTSPL